MSATRIVDPHAAVLDMRPQAYGRGRADRVVDPIIEPRWFGRRVLVAVDRERGATMGIEIDEVRFAPAEVVVVDHDFVPRIDHAKARRTNRAVP